MRDLISVTPARVDMPTREPRMTAIVLTHRRESELARTLAQLAKLPEQPAIVVVDNASNDGTAAMVRRRFPRATLVRAPRNLGAAGRNLGAACARTPYIAFCDDDTWWESGSLTLAAQLFERHPRIGALTARVLVGIERREDPTCALMRASPLVRSRAEPQPDGSYKVFGTKIFITWGEHDMADNIVHLVLART
ncbi:glycosyltransferase family 2 protein, partial [Burkholderia mallei]|uniref:glycosyltransferase family 2 protein n=1 Tax=Burkholderia mallei TaxID=13373 RepID=UPI003081F47B